MSSGQPASPLIHVPPYCCIYDAYCAANLPPACSLLLQVGFSGWARMAQTIDRFGVTEVRKPKVGENKPAAVTGEREGPGVGGGDRGGAGWSVKHG